jgi:hypothetical protein
VVMLFCFGLIKYDPSNRVVRVFSDKKMKSASI